MTVPHMRRSVALSTLRLEPPVPVAAIAFTCTRDIVFSVASTRLTADAIAVLVLQAVVVRRLCVLPNERVILRIAASFTLQANPRVSGEVPPRAPWEDELKLVSGPDSLSHHA